jgi:hypothetical protein
MTLPGGGVRQVSKITPITAVLGGNQALEASKARQAPERSPRLRPARKLFAKLAGKDSL